MARVCRPTVCLIVGSMSGLLDGKTRLGVVRVMLRFLVDYYGNEIATLSDMVVLAVRIADSWHGERYET